MPHPAVRVPVGMHGRVFWTDPGSNERTRFLPSSLAGFVIAGYFYNGTAAAPAKCPVNTAAPALRAIGMAADCPPCPSGSSTGSLTGQTVCGGELPDSQSCSWLTYCPHSLLAFPRIPDVALELRCMCVRSYSCGVGAWLLPGQ